MKKDNVIKDNFKQLMEEASLHSQKKQTQSSYSSFRMTKKQNDKDEMTPVSQSKSSKKTKTAVISEEDTSAVRGSKIGGIQSEKKKKRRKSSWEQGGGQAKHVVSVIDKRINMKQLNAKSLLCFGGVRSGKSDFALAYANMFKGTKAFIATMQSPKDFEKQEQKKSSKEKENVAQREASSVVHEKKIKKKSEEKSEQDVSASTFDMQALAKSEDYKTVDTKEALKNSLSEGLEDVGAKAEQEVSDMFRIHSQMDQEAILSAKNSGKSIAMEIPSSPQLSETVDFPVASQSSKGKEKEKKKEKFFEQAAESREKGDKKHEKDKLVFELDDRIEKHKAQRGQDWITIEEPYKLVQALHKAKKMNCSVALVDCVTLWLTNLIFQDKTDEQIFEKIEELAETLINPPLPVVLVSNEVGLGVVPDNALARRFRDLQGKANQILSKDVHAVVFCMSGNPLLLKG